MKKRELTLGLFGFGCVGQGLYHVLKQTNGIEAEVKKVCVKDKKKKRPIDASLITFDKNELLFDNEINVIVEMIDDAEEAFAITVQAMKQSKGVVSANKKMVAEHFQELYDLQKEYNVPFLYEASSCASIPIIRNLEEYYDNDLLSGVEGIFNGSSNYILTKMFAEGWSYQKALKEAQDLGFAETDPTLDVGGYDPKYKLVIMMAHSFGVFVDPKEVVNYGIQNLGDQDIKFAREKGWKIKLVAGSKREGNKVTGFVLPKFVKSDDKLFMVDYEYNGVVVQGAFSDEQFFVGKGAGSYPTGSAVLSDVSALTFDYKYEYKKYHQSAKPLYVTGVDLEVYCRFSDMKDLNKVIFKEVKELHKSQDYNYIIGVVSLDILAASGAFENDKLFFSLMPEGAVDFSPCELELNHSDKANLVSA